MNLGKTYITYLYITLNTKRHHGLNVKILNYYIHINELISKMIIACQYCWLLDFKFDNYIGTQLSFLKLIHLYEYIYEYMNIYNIYEYI